MAANCACAGFELSLRNRSPGSGRGARRAARSTTLAASPTVLAATTFSGDHLRWIEGTVMPVVRKRRRDKGRGFYCSIGHGLNDLRLPQVTEIICRGAGGRAIRLSTVAGENSSGTGIRALEV